MYLTPVVVAAPVSARNENVLSPAVASPCVPSAYSGCDGEPPIAERSALTAMPVLGGVDAGTTWTDNSTLVAGSIPDGDAMPVPDGWLGLPPHAFGGAELLRGIAATLTKSERLSSVSMHPFPRRTDAVVLLSPGAGFVPSKQSAVPYPTRSATRPPSGHEPVKGAVLATSATFAFVALSVSTPALSGPARIVVPPAPCDSCTR